MVLNARIELAPAPYQRAAPPLTLKEQNLWCSATDLNCPLRDTNPVRRHLRLQSMGLTWRFELQSAGYKPAVLPLNDISVGARCENRTHLSTLARSHFTTKLIPLERVAGNDPASSVWKTEALPLDDTRIQNHKSKVVKDQTAKWRR